MKSVPLISNLAMIPKHPISTMVLLSLSISPTVRAEPDWVPSVVVRGPDRSTLVSTPMVHRPYRPLHFVGNTVRRMHYRGAPLPQPRDVRDGWSAWSDRFGG